MSVTLNNGRLIKHQADGSGPMASAPDACKTPPFSVPVPYPNMSFNSLLVKGTKKVLLNGAPAVIKASKLTMSTGDEAGSCGGVATSVVKQAVVPLSCSFDCMFEGQGVVRQMDLSGHNCSGTSPNTIGMFL